MTALPTVYQNIIGLSRYARYMPDKNRRETWEETVGRLINYITPLAASPSDPDSLNKLEELRTAILNLEVMPSMRLLMSAGEACERDNIAAYNCFSGDTKYYTNSGLKSFADTVGTEQTILCGDGGWRKAQVSSFGKQQLTEVTFKPSRKTNITHTVKVTANHRWLTQRGEVTDLQPGDKVFFVPSNDQTFNAVDFVRGFGFGDGTLTNRGTAQIRLCGDKAKYLSYFEEVGNNSICYPPSSNGDPTVIFRKGHFEDWKQLPTNPTWSWFQGWFAADGHLNPVQPGLSTQDREAADLLVKYASIAGVAATGRNVMSTPTNYGERSNPLIRITVRDDVIFTVVGIKYPTQEAEPEEVYCVTEPITGSFVLENGILTGNCSYLAVNNKRAFSEALYILMNGTGVGFSCERQEISQLPQLPETFRKVDDVIVVADSKLGWAKAYKKLLSYLWEGDIPTIDYSRVRPAGARLKTFGGRASGPDPLRKLFNFSIETLAGAAGRKLNSLEVHELMCMVGEIVVVGGVRRSALISLSNLTDRRMREAKMGAWYNDKPHLGLANNSVAYTETPDAETFLEEWLSLVKSKSGERGIFNRVAAQKQAVKSGRDGTLSYGCNPCSEIILRDKQFCNLTEVVVRAGDTVETLKRKVELATILGTIQSTLTNFQFLSEEWKRNTEEERLLGVSLTGIMDNPLTSNPDPAMLEELKAYAKEVNREWAEKLGVPASASITCVKPSGTVSQLVDSASGIHARHNPFYIRRIRMDKKDPIYDFLKDKGVSVEDEAYRPESTAVFSFPMKAPEGAICRTDMTAMEQLNLWLVYQRHWCDHKPSVTISVKDKEWPAVGAWVWEHFDEVSGISFLPFSEHTYVQAPYQDITEEEYNELYAAMPKDIDWSEFVESEDNTEGMQQLACVGGSCEI